MFSGNFSDFKSFLILKKKDVLALIFLLAFMIILSYFLLRIDMDMGAYYVRDVFFYLNNALRFAGLPAGLSASQGLSPFVPFLTSLIFRLGYVQDSAIMIVSTIFFVLSTMVMYAFLRLKFNEIYSLSGSIIFSTFSINLAWASKGMLDIPALFFSILIVYFAFLAITKNSRYWYLVFPILVLGFFTRYTVVLVLLVALISVFTLDKPFKYIKDNLKNIFTGLGLGILSSIPFLIYYYLNNIPLFFLSQTKAISSETATAVGVVVKTNPLYYLNNLLIYISTPNSPPYSIKPGAFQFLDLKWIGGEPSIVAYILFAVFIVGMIIYISKLLSKENRSLILNKKDMKFYIKLLVFLVFMASFLITFYNISVIYSLILFSIAILALYRLLYKSKIPYINLSFLVFYWFMVNLIFFSSHLTKVDRYGITLTPAIAYFVVLSMHMIYKFINDSKNKNKYLKSKSNYLKSESKISKSESKSLKLDNELNHKSKFKSKLLNFSKVFLPIFLIVISILFTATNFSNDPVTFDNQKHDDILNASQNEKIIANFIMNSDKNYESKVIWADRGGDFSFFLRKNIPSVDSISNQTNFTDVLINNNVSYFIANGKNNNIGDVYKLVKIQGNVYLYKRV